MTRCYFFLQGPVGAPGLQGDPGTPGDPVSCSTVFKLLIVQQVFDYFLNMGNLTLSQSPCTALTAGICLPLGLCKRTVTGVWKRWEFPLVAWAHNAMGHYAIPIYIRPINHKRVLPANWRPCPFSTDSLIATKLGLCSTLMNNRSIIIRDRFANYWTSIYYHLK